MMKMSSLKNISATLRFAFEKSIPIIFGYIFLGFAFGILLQQTGYHALWAFFASLTIYAGSMQFVLISLLASGSPLVTAAVMTLLINSRHIFYGLTFIEKFKSMGRLYPYMVFSLTDETYSVLCSCKYPDNVNMKKADFFIALFNQCYWIIGSVLGGLFGQLITLDMKGIDFSMTALFVVIFIEQWKDYKSHIPAVTGLLSSILFLLLLGPDNFILPSLTVSVVLLIAFRQLVGKKMEVAET